MILKKIQCQMIGEAYKRHGMVYPVQSFDWHQTFTIETLRDIKYIYLWYNDDQDDTHVIRKRTAVGTDCPLKNG